MAIATEIDRLDPQQQGKISISFAGPARNCVPPF
jgi:hypothetical protein